MLSAVGSIHCESRPINFISEGNTRENIAILKYK